MSEATFDSSHETLAAPSSDPVRRAAAERIRIIGAVQSTVGAYLSRAQIEDVATAVARALRLDA